MARLLLASAQNVTDFLCSTVPSFPVRADQVSVLYKPQEFYKELINSCSQATRRIVLVSLYLGTGELEKKLVDVIRTRSQTCGSSLKIKILLDAVRGSRGDQNSRTMLMPLLKQHSQCQVALFHTPRLKGILRTLLPLRYNEVIGLQHMKIYIVDDNVLISGANLSHDYFTNRQDRYILAKNCGQLADFFEGLVNIVCDMSLQLNSSNSVTFPERDYHPFKKSTKMYVNELHRRISTYYSSFIDENKKSEVSDTWIFPTIEVPPCDIHVDSQITNRLLKSVSDNSLIYLASGYFNLTERLVDTILNSKAKFNILMAHPTANGFYKSSGFSRYIPAMYSEISKQFYEAIEKSGNTHRVSAFEYERKNWTFHGKGIWITFPGERLPQLTIIGSSNFGVRSEIRDLESQIIIVTNDTNLKKKLQHEQKLLFEYGTILNHAVFSEIERKFPFWISIAVYVFRTFF